MIQATSLIADKEGALYGTTSGGGYGYGTAFKLTPPAQGQTTWTESLLYRFCLQPSCSDGRSPSTGLIIDKQGDLYGTTQIGGIGATAGNGIVFKLTPPAQGETTWTDSVLYSFCSLSNCSDGSNPDGSLIADSEGALYGTTGGGGIGGAGTVFKLRPPTKGQTAWTETVLYSFTGANTGIAPVGGVIADNEGALYGTTVYTSGNANGASGPGTVFKLTPPSNGRTTWTASVLYRFTGGTDGANPTAGVISNKHGALYGTTVNGGTAPNNPGYGTIFKLTFCPEQLSIERREKDGDHDPCPVFLSDE